MLFCLHTENHIYFVEKAVLADVSCEDLSERSAGNHTLLTMILPKESSVFERKKWSLELLKDFMAEKKIKAYKFETDTCRSVPFLRHLGPDSVIYRQNDAEAETHPELFIEMAEYLD